MTSPLPALPCVFHGHSCLADPIRVPDAAVVTATVRAGVVTLRAGSASRVDVPVLDSMVWRFPGAVDVVEEVTATATDPTPWQPASGW